MYRLLLYCLATLLLLPLRVQGYDTKTVEILQLDVPDAPQAGQDVRLTCRFRLRGQNHRLYTVNWWRGKDQFYTYKGTNYDPKHAYTFRGIQVKTDESNDQSVVLRNVSEETSGVFKCEVMGEGPSFRTAVAHKLMQVVVPPSRVKITSSYQRNPPHYSVGERIHLNCTAKGAKPRAQISWDINGIPVEQGQVTKVPDFEDHDGRVTSTVSLAFDAPMYFTNNIAQVACHAQVGGHTKTDSTDLYLHPASSAAYNHQYASAGCQLSTTWTILSMASLLLSRAIP